MSETDPEYNVARCMPGDSPETEARRWRIVELSARAKLAHEQMQYWDQQAYELGMEIFTLVEQQRKADGRA